MAKYLETRAIPGGGQIIRTGPAFVTRETAADVIALTGEGAPLKGLLSRPELGAAVGAVLIWLGFAFRPGRHSAVRRAVPPCSTPLRRSASWPSPSPS